MVRAEVSRILVPPPLLEAHHGKKKFLTNPENYDYQSGEE